ncbi:MAG: recombination protein RecR [Phycisphaerae bacterium]|nr:recombination protein RecR [Phycisphaerae bacterium]
MSTGPHPPPPPPPRSGPDQPGGRAARPSSQRTAASASAYPEPVERLIDELARLPGIGRRSAERLAFHILKSEPDAARALARAVTDVKEHVRHCRVCSNLSDADRCAICQSPKRDHGLVLVVEQPKDLIALELTGMFRGVYHVLMGHISPLDGIGPGDLTIAALLDRIDHPEHNSGPPGQPPAPVREVIMGLNPPLEGDGTALHLARELASRPHIKVSRLARGLPTGSQIEYANRSVLADAIEGRQGMDGSPGSAGT